MSGKNVAGLSVDDKFQSRNYLSKLMLHAAPEVSFGAGKQR
jgi:hypothetical protein